MIGVVTIDGGTYRVFSSLVHTGFLHVSPQWHVSDWCTVLSNGGTLRQSVLGMDCLQTEKEKFDLVLNYVHYSFI